MGRRVARGGGGWTGRSAPVALAASIRPTPVGLGRVHRVAVDPERGLVLAGGFGRGTSFRGAAPSGPTAGDYVGGAGDDLVTASAVDGAGNVYITGGYEGAVELAGTTLHGRRTREMFLASFTAEGRPRWVRAFGGFGGGNSVAADESGNVYVTGSVQHEVDFGTGFLPGDVCSDAFLLALTTDGATRWARRFRGPGHDRGAEVTLGAGNTFLAELAR